MTQKSILYPIWFNVSATGLKTKREDLLNLEITDPMRNNRCTGREQRTTNLDLCGVEAKRTNNMLNESWVFSRFIV